MSIINDCSNFSSSVSMRLKKRDLSSLHVSYFWGFKLSSALFEVSIRENNARKAGRYTR